MKMIVEQNHCINPERPLLTALANGGEQENAGGIHIKNRGALFRYHREKERTAGNISAPKVGYTQYTEIKLKKCRVRCAHRIVAEIDFSTAKRIVEIVI